MKSRRIIKAGLALAIVMGVVGVSLALLTDTSAAQGPGGARGRNGAGAGGNGPTQGVRAQIRMQVDPPCCNQTGALQTRLGARGNANAYRGGGAPGAQVGPNLTLLPPAVPGEVPASVVDALTAGWLDEFNAYTTYQAVIDQFGPVAPFVNIQRAEAQHMAALEAMFERYGLALPAPAADGTPQFATLAEACAAAQAVESANAGLYDQWLAAVQDYPDLVQVFTALRNASLNQHLPAFERCAG